MLLGISTQIGYGQSGNDFILADRLMQQQQYEPALSILQKLHSNDPYQEIFFERLVECHIQLKQYDEALALSEKLPSKIPYQSEANILIGQLYHFKGDTARAFSIWDKNLNEHGSQIQVFMNTAQAMSKRNLHLKAVEVYEKARVVFKNGQIFLNDIANELMQAGEYERAISEWIRFLEARPEQLTYIQRMLLRYNDPLVYDITILEVEDKLAELPIDATSYRTIFQFQLWLLQENKLYRRALVTARAYENSTINFNYSLFNLGRQLIENKEFELAVDAFSYYIEKGNGEVKWRSMEELAKNYSLWAKHIDDFNLDFSNQKDSLFTIASTLLDQLIKQGDTYSRLGNAVIAKAEIDLDHTYNLDAVEKSKQILEGLNGYQESPELAYLEGRLYLADSEFTQARVAFTKSNKRAEIGELAEKTRYFLALTDFFTGDYEFAKIQLKSLGRQNTSYYANDALELRLWLQEGISTDSTGSILEPFAKAVYHSTLGHKEEAKQLFLSMLDDPTSAVFHDDVYLQLSNLGILNPALHAKKTSEFLSSSPFISLKERLMWERAKFAEEAVNNGSKQLSLDQVIGYYEALILDYPQGFYASQARERLQFLIKPNS